jgi:hypothetical protein
MPRQEDPFLSHRLFSRKQASLFTLTPAIRIESGKENY